MHTLLRVCVFLYLLLQVLTEVGDKEPPFVGSKQWIGSFEVSIVLNHLLGVTSRITNVPSGADMGSLGRELLRHFEEEGTPVMIGRLVCGGGCGCVSGWVCVWAWVRVGVGACGCLCV